MQVEHAVAELGQAEAKTRSRLGRYHVLGPLAAGGMAEILLAEEIRGIGPRRRVAIKRILPSLSDSPIFVDMLRDEASILSHLSHPNIVRVYEVAKDGCDFIAMEFVEGRNLFEIMRRLHHLSERFPQAIALRVLVEVCSGLEHAHGRVDGRGRPLKIVHRDLSPHNVLVSFGGEVKLIDFGVAKAADNSTRTDSNQIKGKCSYMSPEQALQRPVDARSDLFALGILSYELLTGRRPFLRKNMMDTLSAVIFEEPIDCRRRNPEIADAVAAVIGRALEKDPSRRWQSATDLRGALEQCLEAMELSTPLEIRTWLRGIFPENGGDEGAIALAETGAIPETAGGPAPLGDFAEKTALDPTDGFEDVETELDLTTESPVYRSVERALRASPMFSDESADGKPPTEARIDGDRTDGDASENTTLDEGSDPKLSGLRRTLSRDRCGAPATRVEGSARERRARGNVMGIFGIQLFSPDDVEPEPPVALDPSAFVASILEIGPPHVRARSQMGLVGDGPGSLSAQPEEESSDARRDLPASRRTGCSDAPRGPVGPAASIPCAREANTPPERQRPMSAIDAVLSIARAVCSRPRLRRARAAAILRVLAIAALLFVFASATETGACSHLSAAASDSKSASPSSVRPDKLR
jgi:serine/threonine protein kinase